MSKWQPIETAPRDGTRVLVFSRHSSEPFIASWERAEAGFEAWATGAPWRRLFHEGVTHWMAPPAPPIDR